MTRRGSDFRVNPTTPRKRPKCFPVLTGTRHWKVMRMHGKMAVFLCHLTTTRWTYLVHFRLIREGLMRTRIRTYCFNHTSLNHRSKMMILSTTISRTLNLPVMEAPPRLTGSSIQVKPYALCGGPPAGSRKLIGNTLNPSRSFSLFLDAAQVDRCLVILYAPVLLFKSPF